MHGSLERAGHGPFFLDLTRIRGSRSHQIELTYQSLRFVATTRDAHLVAVDVRSVGTQYMVEQLAVHETGTIPPEIEALWPRSSKGL